MAYTDPEKRNAYARAWYQRNKADHMERVKLRDKRVRREIQNWIVRYLLEHPCVDCGEADPIVLEFDHRPDTVKLFEIATYASKGGLVLAKIQAEIAKCDVRCANCHRRLTYRTRRHKSRELVGE